MLLFSQCCRSSDHLIQVLDGVLQFLDVLLGSGDAFLGVGDGGFSVGDVPLQPFLLIVSVIELLAAILLLAVIVDLLALQSRDHTVNHRNHFREADLLAAQRQHDDVQVRSALGTGRLPKEIQGASAHGSGPALHLHERGTRSRKSLLEQLEGIVIIENLNGLSDRDELILAGLAPRLPLRVLGGAALLQLLQHCLVLQQLRLGVREVVLQLHDRDAELPGPLGLRLDLRREGVDLLLLGGHELLVGLGCCVLVAGRIGQALSHLVAQLL
mmetsp:Transcript_76444/g.216659  ORF Transcript_76444/g.216659 Transcript_76444/m.216659 type:complete len:270 (+) Transcript_76444:804-1613(+)